MKIKPSIIFSFLALIIITSCTKQIEFNGTFSIDPEKPKPGEKVLVKYDPANTVLSNSEEIKMFVYQYDVEVESSSEFEMLKNENGWTAEFIVHPETKGIIIIFAEGETQDNNDEKGYFIKVYDDNGNLLAGYYAGMAVAQYNWGRRVGVARDLKESIINFKNEFEVNPKNKTEYFDYYFPALIAENSSNANGIIESELSDLEIQKNKSETELNALAKWFFQIGNNIKGTEFENLVLEKYPNGKYAEDKFVVKFNKETDFSKKKDLLKKFETDFPQSKQIPDLYEDIVLNLRNNKDYKNAKIFLESNYGKLAPYFYYSISSRWLNEGGKFEEIESFLREGIKLAEEQAANNTLTKPAALTYEQYIEELKFYAGMNQFLLAEQLNIKGNKIEAMELLEKGIDNTFEYYPQQQQNELFVQLLIETGNYDKAIRTLEKFIVSGNGSAEQMNMLKDAYVNLHGSDDGYDNYASKFEESAKAKIIDKLKKEIMQKPAPDFTLTDLNGKSVSLADYKGKTVILDFWATWCGPCLKSFPGVKNAVENFRDDESVKFLFVNTWERVDNKKENAEEFIAKNKYPFHVLMDNENKVVADYKVSGIPTKFIIDKNGFIRFQSVGFSGNTDQVVTEITEMINMIN